MSQKLRAKRRRKRCLRPGFCLYQLEGASSGGPALSPVPRPGEGSEAPGEAKGWGCFVTETSAPALTFGDLRKLARAAFGQGLSLGDVSVAAGSRPLVRSCPSAVS